MKHNSKNNQPLGFLSSESWTLTSLKLYNSYMTSNTIHDLRNSLSVKNVRFFFLTSIDDKQHWCLCLLFSWWSKMSDCQKGWKCFIFLHVLFPWVLFCCCALSSLHKEPKAGRFEFCVCFLMRIKMRACEGFHSLILDQCYLFPSQTLTSWCLILNLTAATLRDGLWG